MSKKRRGRWESRPGLIDTEKREFGFIDLRRGRIDEAIIINDHISLIAEAPLIRSNLGPLNFFFFPCHILSIPGRLTFATNACLVAICDGEQQQDGASDSPQIATPNSTDFPDEV